MPGQWVAFKPTRQHHQRDHQQLRWVSAVLPLATWQYYNVLLPPAHLPRGCSRSPPPVQLTCGQLVCIFDGGGMGAGTLRQSTGTEYTGAGEMSRSQTQAQLPWRGFRVQATSWQSVITTTIIVVQITTIALHYQGGSFRDPSYQPERISGHPTQSKQRQTQPSSGGRTRKCARSFRLKGLSLERQHLAAAHCIQSRLQ